MKKVAFSSFAFCFEVTTKYGKVWEQATKEWTKELIGKGKC